VSTAVTCGAGSVVNLVSSIAVASAGEGSSPSRLILAVQIPSGDCEFSEHWPGHESVSAARGLAGGRGPDNGARETSAMGVETRGVPRRTCSFRCCAAMTTGMISTRNRKRVSVIAIVVVPSTGIVHLLMVAGVTRQTISCRGRSSRRG
jgi:hypothetical protein